MEPVHQRQELADRARGGEGLSDDWAGLDEIGRDPKDAPKKAQRRKIVATDDASPVDQIRMTLAQSCGTVLTLFREWDDDSSQTISKREFRRALPVLGLSVEPADADALFEAFDTDGSGEIDYNELAKQLRPGMAALQGVELDEALKDGAMGEIELEAKNRLAVRTHARDGSEGPALEASVEAMKKAMVSQCTRVVDFFRTLDVNGDGTVARSEFAAALPVLGFGSDGRDAIEALFDQLDADGSGTLEYKELNAALRGRDDVE